MHSLLKRIVPLCLAILALTFGATTGLHAAIAEDAVAATLLLVHGREATADELRQALGRKPESLAELVQQEKAELQRIDERARAAATRAFRDAFGRDLTPADSRPPPAGQAQTYAERLAGHVQRLSNDAREYEATLHRAYQRSQKRDAYPGEIKYWRSRPVVPFALLVACIDNWARRNAPGLMETEGVPSASYQSEYLVAVRLSPQAATEVRSALGLGWGESADVARGMQRVIIAPGAASVVSVGGVHFAAAGRD